MKRLPIVTLNSWKDSARPKPLLLTERDSGETDRLQSNTSPAGITATYEIRHALTLPLDMLPSLEARYGVQELSHYLWYVAPDACVCPEFTPYVTRTNSDLNQRCLYRTEVMRTRSVERGRALR